MDDKKIIKLAALGFIGFTVIPAVVGGGIKLVSNTAIAISNGIEKAKYKRKIKKGLEDGSIIEIDGQYYEVQVTE